MFLAIANRRIKLPLPPSEIENVVGGAGFGRRPSSVLDLLNWRG